MARIRSVKPEFWADEYLAEHASRDARMLYIGLWNLADEHGRMRGGVRYLKGHVFPYDDDLSAADVEKLLIELEQIGRVQRYSVTGESYLFLPKLSKHQRLEPKKAESRWPAPPELVEADCSTSDGKSAQNTDECAPGADLPGELSPSMEHVAGDMEHVAGEGEKPSSELAPRADVERLCELLADLIELNGSKRPPIKQSWRDACRLLIDRDGRTEQQVENAIRWCQHDEFWRANVLSMPKLREKYEQLRLAAQRDGPKAKPSTTNLRVQAAADLREQFRALEEGA